MKGSKAKKRLLARQTAFDEMRKRAIGSDGVNTIHMPRPVGYGYDTYHRPGSNKK